MGIRDTLRSNMPFQSQPGMDTDELHLLVERAGQVTPRQAMVSAVQFNDNAGTSNADELRRLVEKALRSYGKDTLKQYGIKVPSRGLLAPLWNVFAIIPSLGRHPIRTVKNLKNDVPRLIIEGLQKAPAGDLLLKALAVYKPVLAKYIEREQQHGERFHLDPDTTRGFMYAAAKWLQDTRTAEKRANKFKLDLFLKGPASLALLGMGVAGALLIGGLTVGLGGIPALILGASLPIKAAVSVVVAGLLYHPVIRPLIVRTPFGGTRAFAKRAVRRSTQPLLDAIQNEIAPALQADPVDFTSRDARLEDAVGFDRDADLGGRNGEAPFGPPRGGLRYIETPGSSAGRPAPTVAGESLSDASSGPGGLTGP